MVSENLFVGLLNRSLCKSRGKAALTWLHLDLPRPGERRTHTGSCCRCFHNKTLEGSSLVHHFRHILVLVSCLPLTTHFYWWIKVSIQTKVLKPIAALVQVLMPIVCLKLEGCSLIVDITTTNCYYLLTSLAQTNWKLTSTLFASSLNLDLFEWWSPLLQNGAGFRTHQRFFGGGGVRVGGVPPFSFSIKPFPWPFILLQVPMSNDWHSNMVMDTGPLFWTKNMQKKNFINCQVRYHTYVDTRHFNMCMSKSKQHKLPPL